MFVRSHFCPRASLHQCSTSVGDVLSGCIGAKCKAALHQLHHRVSRRQRMGKRAASAQNKRLRKKFAHLRGVSDAAVARILMKIKRNPGIMEDLYEGQDVAQSLRAEKIRSDNPTLFKEETLQMNDGSTFIWLYGDFQQLVIYFVETCPAFRATVAESLAKHPLLVVRCRRRDGKSCFLFLNF